MNNSAEINFIKLSVNSVGDSVFIEERICLDEHPETNLCKVTRELTTEYTKFLQFKSAAVFDLHTAPCKQYLFVLSGRIEIEITSGEKRHFQAGSFLFVEDTAGKGHITRVLGSEPALVVVCPIKVPHSSF